MDNLVYLIAAALGLGSLGLIAFLWALKSGQFEDLEGAANRILFDDEGQDQPEKEDIKKPSEPGHRTPRGPS